MKERDRGENEWKWRNRRNKNIPPLPLPAARPSSTFSLQNKKIYLGPVVQSVASLTSSLVVKLLTVLVSTGTFAEKMWVAFHIFSAKIYSVYAIFNDRSFNDTLTNDIVSFEQLGPIHLFSWAIGIAS